MYTIGNVIYGWPVTERLCTKADSKGEQVEDFATTFYHGSSDFTRGYIGAALTDFDAIEDLELDKINQLPTPTEVKAALRAMSNAPVWVQNFYKNAPPKVWIVWGTS